MEAIRETLCDGFSPSEYSCIPHSVCLDDFNTNHPNPNRINRIASEINEYLKHKHKNVNA